jgi:hypothetical protein
MLSPPTILAKISYHRAFQTLLKRDITESSKILSLHLLCSTLLGSKENGVGCVNIEVDLIVTGYIQQPHELNDQDLECETAHG